MNFNPDAMFRLLRCFLLLGPSISGYSQVLTASTDNLPIEAAMPTLSIAWPSPREWHASSPKKAQESPAIKSDGKCIEHAASFHGVNPSILQAILMVESNMNPLAINQNKNGTIDVGLGGLNSSHFTELAKFGIAPEQLLNDCVATYVTAWQLKKGINQFGNTWFGVAAYHSTTPYYNSRYQVLLFNQLVADKVLTGPKRLVPSLQP